MLADWAQEGGQDMTCASTAHPAHSLAQSAHSPLPLPHAPLCCTTFLLSEKLHLVSQCKADLVRWLLILAVLPTRTLLQCAPHRVCDSLHLRSTRSARKEGG